MKQSQIIYTQLSHIKGAQIQTIQSLKARTGVSFPRYTTTGFIRVPCYYRYSRDPHRPSNPRNSTSRVYTKTLLLVQQPNQRLYNLGIYVSRHTRDHFGPPQNTTVLYPVRITTVLKQLVYAPQIKWQPNCCLA